MTSQGFEPPNAPPASADELVGSLLADRYRVQRVLGDGGMARVYLGEHVVLRRPVAIKVLRQRLCSQPASVERFLREARAVTRIRHENIVDVIDFGQTPKGSVFIVMEYLEGEDLEQLLAREKRLPWKRAQSIALQIARALRRAHEEGIIHRDLKPANIYLIQSPDRGEQVKLIDFGIAKYGNETGEALTATGAVFGTPRYMAPELARGEKADTRTDIYSLGLLMYEMLAGQPVFSGQGMYDLINKHLTVEPTALRTIVPNHDVPPSVEQLLLHMLAKEPAGRPAEISEVEARLVQPIEEVSQTDLPSRASSPSLPITKNSGTMVLDYSPGAPISPQSNSTPTGTLALEGMGGDVLAQYRAQMTSHTPSATVAIPSSQLPIPPPAQPVGSPMPESRTKPGLSTPLLLGALALLLAGALGLSAWLLMREDDTPPVDTITSEPETLAPQTTTAPETTATVAEPTTAAAVATTVPEATTEAPETSEPATPKRGGRPKRPRKVAAHTIATALAPAREAAKRCGSLASVVVVLEVSASGEVASARAKKPFAGNEVGRCVERAAKKIKLPATGTAHRRTETFVL